MGHSSELRKQIDKAIRKGELTKLSSCEKCGSAPTGGPRQIKAHVPNPDSPLDVIWLCQSCFILANPLTYSRKDAVRRKQNVRKAPPYEQMKLDYLAGWNYQELAERWGISGAPAAWNLLRARAQAHGDWPLPKVQTRIKVSVIWDLVRSEVGKQTESEIVLVTQKEADRYAPFCRFLHRAKGGMTRNEIWPASRVRYHRAHCGKLRPAGDATFTIDRSVAEDWGYEACQLCAKGISLEAYAARHGFSLVWIYELSRGRIETVTFAQARALLASINEPIPRTLWTQADREREQAAAAA